MKMFVFDSGSMLQSRIKCLNNFLLFWTRAVIISLNMISWIRDHENKVWRVMIFPSFVVLFIDADIIVSFNSNFLSFYWRRLWDWAFLLANVSSPKSDIISLEAVVEGHPFPVTFKYILHKQALEQSHQQVVNSWFYLHWNACRSLLMKTAWLTFSDGGAVSFIWMQIQRESWLWCRTSTSSPHATDLQRYCANLVISLENIIKSASTSVKKIISEIPHSSARYTMCYCPIWQDPIWYEISTDRAEM